MSAISSPVGTTQSKTTVPLALGDQRKRRIESLATDQKDKSGTKEKKARTGDTLSSEAITRMLSQACSARPDQGLIPAQWSTIFDILYKPARINYTSEPRRESESEEYGACRFALNNQTVVFRVAKTTPKKVGQFVTLWKRPGGGSTAPLSATDRIDFVVVSVLNGSTLGQFIFDKATLIKQGILAANGQKGKMAFRVYPPAVKATVKTAIQAQRWQVQHFHSLAPTEFTNSTKMNQLFTKMRHLFKVV